MAGRSVFEFADHLRAGTFQAVAQHVDGAVDQPVQVGHFAHRRLLPHQGKKALDDARASLRRRMDLLRTLLDAAGRLRLEQACMRHHDGERIVELMRHAGEQRTHRRQFLRLMDSLALLGDLVVGVLYRRKIAQIGGKRYLARQVDAVDRYLDREHFAVCPDALQLDAPAKHIGLARLLETPHAVIVIRAIGRRNDGFGYQLSDGVSGGISEHLLRGRVEAGDPAFAVRYDDGVERRIDDGRVLGLGLPQPLQELGRFALRLEDAACGTLPMGRQPDGISALRSRGAATNSTSCIAGFTKAEASAAYSPASVSNNAAITRP